MQSRFCIVICILVSTYQFAWSENSSKHLADDIYSRYYIHQPASATSGMVASQEKLASLAGLEVLQEGGNAVDAAVTVAFTLAVTLPRAGNLGGGGFMLIHDAQNNTTVCIDYRECAPGNAYEKMFQNGSGEASSTLSTGYPRGVGVPGTPHGLLLALEKYGTISRKRALKPAIRLAEQGFLVSQDFYESLIKAKQSFQKSDAAIKVFYCYDGNPPKIGTLLRQPDLAKTLKQIEVHGKEGFYSGSVANAIAEDMKQSGGLITIEDLNNYQAIVRQPVYGHYRGYSICSMPPPSSGGVHLIQMLNMMQNFDFRKAGHNSAQSIHLMTEIMKLAYADRSEYLGDPDFNPIPVNEITSLAYANKLISMVYPDHATPSSEINPGNPYDLPYESNETTHFSVVDQWGNAVSNTYTLNFSYGCKYMIPGTGVLLNNEMDDFTSKPGIANSYGLIGSELNSIEPKKRMLSSMSPTIVFKNGKVFLVTGSPGGSRIITSVLQIITNVIDHDMNIADATHAPRFHHQWFPDVLRIESGFSSDTLQLLNAKGHKIEEKSSMGATQSIMVIGENQLEGCSDPRRQDSLTIGY